MNDVTLIFTLLFTKHFIVDFPLQKPYQYLNKGTYGHGGGILHASLHGLFTALCFWYWAPLSCLFLGFFDAFIHYHVDWAKMNLNKKMGWGPQTHEEFWWLLGLDQFLHALTYIGLVSLVTQ
jgi:hypothetical protein